MAYHASQIALVPCLLELDHAVISFAERNSLKYRSREQVMVWRISAEFLNGRQRRLQVGAYVAEVPWLSIMPRVHILEGLHQVKIPILCNVERFPLEEVMLGDRLSVLKLHWRLESAWQLTESLNYEPGNLVVENREDAD